MKKTIEKFYCDICGVEHEVMKHINYPVIFLTEQTEGRSCTPYISYQHLDVCEDCLEKICRVSGVGAQGYNTYKIIGGHADE